MQMNKVMIGVIASALMAAPAMAVVVPSTPALFSTVGDTFSINFSQGYDGANGGTPLPGLTAEAIFRLSSISDGTAWTFVIDRFANTSSAPVETARLVAFGFDVARDFANVSSTGIFETATSGGSPFSITNGLNVEVCFTVKGPSCSGGGEDGLVIGDVVTDVSNTFTLNFEDVQTLVTLNNFVVRYQAISAPHADFDLSSSGVGTAGAVPEPASWAMLIAGFGLVGSAMRRRQRMGAIA